MRDLPEGDVHVWSIRLDGSEDRIRRLAQVLSRDEMDRANRFRFDVHRHRFIAARSAMRHLLAEYGGVDPQVLRFHYGHRGKPDLPDFPWLHFNLSHSEDRALLAVTRVAPIGVDIEYLRSMPDLMDIAERFFARGEVERLVRQPSSEHAPCFFRCWTRKEAYLKAVGEGLAIPLNRFEVTHEPDREPRFLAFRDPKEAPEAWSLHHLDPEAGYFGAVALRASPEAVKLEGWDG